MPTRDTVPGLAARLTAARQAAGLDQTTAAARAGLSRPLLSKYERDRKAPSMMTVYRLARAYGVELHELAPTVAEVLGPAPAEGEGRP